MSFRKVIAAEVRRQGLSGYRLAKLSGLPIRTVQAYLAEDFDLTGERLARLTKALGLELKRERGWKKRG